MLRAPWPVALLASLTATACLITDNPGFERAESGSTSTTGTSTTSTSTTSTTSTTSITAPTTSGGSATGSSGEASSDPLLTITGDATTTTTTTTDATTTTGDLTTGDASTTSETTGTSPPMTAELKHYSELGACKLPFWCFNGEIKNPATAENWDAECFDAPLAPPFTVTRVGFAVFGSKADPGATLEFHDYDDKAQRPVKDPFDTRDLDIIASPGYHDFTLAMPVVVDVQRFCISVHSGEKYGSQLGVAVDDMPAPPGQTFVGMNGPMACNIDKFTELATINELSKTQWCIDATILKHP